MGRRSRGRERGARPAPPGRGQAAGQGQAGTAGRPRRGRWAAALNPFSFQRPSRSRVGYAAVGFGLLAVVAAVLAWLTDTAAWFNSAVLLGILAVAWGARAALMGGDGGSGEPARPVGDQGRSPGRLRNGRRPAG